MFFIGTPVLDQKNEQGRQKNEQDRQKNEQIKNSDANKI